MTEAPRASEPATPQPPSTDAPYTHNSVGMGSYRVLGSVERRLTEDELNNLKRRMLEAMKFYPELDGRVVTVGRKPEGDEWYAEADTDNDVILLPTHEPCPYMTICHELAHLAIYKLARDGKDVPRTSEEFTSMFSVARMPPDRIDTPYISYLGEPSIDRRRWPKVCRRALEYREHSHNYIQKCEEWLGV